MAKDVKIIISMVKPVGSVGFGYPLILEENATKAVEYAEYSNLEMLLDAGYVATGNVYKVAQLMFMQDHAPEKIAICSITTGASEWLAVQANVAKNWRQLVVVNSGTDTTTDVASIMTTIEGQTDYPKLYFANLPLDDETELTTTDIERTVVCYYTPTEAIPVPVAALVGELAGLQIGQYTINNLIVKGVPGLELSEQEVEAIHEKGGITIILSAGDVVMSEGFSLGGVFVDQTDGNDYIAQQLHYKIQKTLNINTKIPYNNEGISKLENCAFEVLKDAQTKGIVDTFTVTFDKYEDVPDEDRIARKYFGGKITYRLLGSIHKVTVYCEVSA